MLPIYIYIYSIDVICVMSFVIKYLSQFEVVRLHDVVKKIREISIHKWVKDRGNISANDVIYLIFCVDSIFIYDRHPFRYVNFYNPTQEGFCTVT